MVLAGAGVDHAELVRLGEKYFGGLKAAAGDGDNGSAGLAESRYHGGESRNIISADKVSFFLSFFLSFFFLLSVFGGRY